MKKIIFIISILLPGLLMAQEITEENYLRLDKELWGKLEGDQAVILEAYKKNPEKKDSLYAESSRLMEAAERSNERLALKFASTPSGLQRLFMVRLDLPKDTLRAALYSLPRDMQESPYGLSIKMHLDNDQIEEGDRYAAFSATRSDGSGFDTSFFDGKTILLLYGGLDCMGAEGRAELEEICRSANSDNFKVVVYCPVSGQDKLVELEKLYGTEYVFISDFKLDHSPFKIIYGAQARPTCFLIDREGMVAVKSLGLDSERIKSFIE